MIPPGLLLELARFGGNVDKWRTDKKEKQRAAEAKAKQKVGEKRKRDDKKDKKQAKKAKKS